MPHLFRKYCPPYYFGRIEGFLKRDITGFCFTEIGGQGRCRIENSISAFKKPTSRIVLGEVFPPAGKSYYHLWAIDDKGVVDSVCPISTPFCRNRRVFAVINATSLVLERSNLTSDEDKEQVRWGLVYLSGFKRSIF